MSLAAIRLQAAPESGMWEAELTKNHPSNAPRRWRVMGCLVDAVLDRSGQSWAALEVPLRHCGPVGVLGGCLMVHEGQKVRTERENGWDVVLRMGPSSGAGRDHTMGRC